MLNTYFPNKKILFEEFLFQKNNEFICPRLKHKIYPFSRNEKFKISNACLLLEHNCTERHSINAAITNIHQR